MGSPECALAVVFVPPTEEGEGREREPQDFAGGLRSEEVLKDLISIEIGAGFVASFIFVYIYLMIFPCLHGKLEIAISTIPTPLVS